MITFILTKSHSTYTSCSIGPKKTPLFVFVSPSLIMPKNLGANVAQFINSSEITCARSHKVEGIEWNNDF